MPNGDINIEGDESVSSGSVMASDQAKGENIPKISDQIKFMNIHPKKEI